MYLSRQRAKIPITAMAVVVMRVSPSVLEMRIMIVDLAVCDELFEWCSLGSKCDVCLDVTTKRDVFLQALSSQTTFAA